MIEASGVFATDNVNSRYVNLTAGTTVVKTGLTSLYGVIVNSHSSGTIKVYDSSTLVTVVPVAMNTFSFPTGSGSYNLHGITLGTGCMVVVGGTADITLAFR